MRPATCDRSTSDGRASVPATSTAMPTPCDERQHRTARGRGRASRISGAAITSWSTNVAPLLVHRSMRREEVGARDADRRARPSRCSACARYTNVAALAVQQHVADDRGEVRATARRAETVERAAASIGGSSSVVLDRAALSRSLSCARAEHRELEQHRGQHQHAGDADRRRRAASSAAGRRTRRWCRPRRSGRRGVRADAGAEQVREQAPEHADDEQVEDRGPDVEHAARS